MKYKSGLITAFCIAALVTTGCRENSQHSENSLSIKDNGLKLMDSIPKILAVSGPSGWLRCFEDSPGFFMVSDGAVAFQDYPAAKRFITDTLSKAFQKIDLHWTDIRIDSISDEAVMVSAVFAETLYQFNGQKTAEKGFFTGTAHRTLNGWKLLNAHWSTKK